MRVVDKAVVFERERRNALVLVTLLIVSPLALAQDAKPSDCSHIKGSSAAAVREYKLCEASFLEPLDPARREWYGELYDPKKFVECVKREPLDAGCDRFRLKRVEQPEYWPYAGKVPPVKWPEAPKQSVYRKGMTPKEYFDALCKAEAGEFIYKTVENVEGIYQIRPRKPASQYELRDRYVMEDPYGYTDQEASDPELIFVGRGAYRYFETPRVTHARFGPHSSEAQQQFRDKSYFAEVPRNALVSRYFGFDKNNLKSIKQEFDATPRSRYGYVWRGISRLYDRENGIAGGEVIVVDFRNGDLLALWRGFAQNRAIKTPGTPISWEAAPSCPLLPDGMFPKDFIIYFLTRVLRPMAQ